MESANAISTSTLPKKPWETSTTAASAIAAPTTPTSNIPTLPVRPTQSYSSVPAYQSSYYPGGGYQPSAYSSYSSANSRYSLPYSRPFGGGYGGSSYGGGYGSGGYGSSYGTGYGDYSQPYGAGSSMMMGGYPGQQQQFPPGSSGSELFGGYQSAFQSLDHIVQAFGGLAHMLDTTLMATHSSFMAMVGLAEQYANFKHFMADLLSVFSLYSLISKFLGRKHPTSITSSDFESFAADTSSTVPVGAVSAKKRSKKPIIVFLLVAFGLPIILGRILKALHARKPPQSSTATSPSTQVAAPNSSAKESVSFAKALYDFDAQNSQEISFRKGDLLAVLMQNGDSEWWRGKLRHGAVGYFPANYVEIVQKPLSQPQIAPVENPVSDVAKYFEE